MPSSVPETTPILAAPGAGLPAVELAVARLLFGFKSRFATPASVHALIRAERQRIDAAVANCPRGRRAERVLIPRPRGLEDSSRFWSVLMTLDHLRIVNRSVAFTVGELLAGRVPTRAASTAAVKPSPEVTEAVVAEFHASCDDLLNAGAATSLRTRARYAHPWFGRLDAFAWKFMGAYHLGLHRRQIETVVAQLTH